MQSIHHLRADRDDCLVGDGVAAATVPEWSTAVTTHRHQPLGISLTAAALTTPLEEPGDDLAPGELPWIFELHESKTGEGPAVSVWRRVS